MGRPVAALGYQTSETSMQLKLTLTILASGRLVVHMPTVRVADYAPNGRRLGFDSSLADATLAAADALVVAHLARTTGSGRAILNPAAY